MHTEKLTISIICMRVKPTFTSTFLDELNTGLTLLSYCCSLNNLPRSTCSSGSKPLDRTVGDSSNIIIVQVHNSDTHRENVLFLLTTHISLDKLNICLTKHTDFRTKLNIHLQLYLSALPETHLLFSNVFIEITAFQTMINAYICILQLLVHHFYSIYYC